MYNVIAVDDEKKALDRFARLIQADPRVQVAGKFTAAAAALRFVKTQPVDIAFLDIEMPSLSGLELAAAMFEENPALEVVFLTAYDKYALQAFQAHAIGYLLKPVEPEDLQEQISQIEKRRQAARRRTESERLSIRCFGPFLCYPAGEERTAIHWRTAKAEELFAMLAQYRGDPAPREAIVDALWPEMAPERAAQNLHVTCQYIRRALRDRGFDGVFVRSRGGYHLRMEQIESDLPLLENALAEIKKGRASLELLEKASALYRGAYLQDKPYGWAIQTRSWFAAEYENIQLRLSACYVETGAPDQAAAALQRIITANPLAEEAYERLVRLKLDLGDRTAAIRYYREYRESFWKEMQLPPSERMQRMLRGMI